MNNPTSKASTYAIPPAELKAAIRATRQGSWRPVLAQVDQWVEAAATVGLKLDVKELEALGAAGLSRKGMRISIGLIDKGLISEVPAEWLRKSASLAQDGLLVELINRSDHAALRASQGNLIGLPKSRDALGWALHHGLLQSLDAFIAHGCQCENALFQLLSRPNEETASDLVSRALALGAPRDTFPSGLSTYDLKVSYGKSSPLSPLQAALQNRQPVLALALIDAGADPSTPAMEGRFGDEPSTTALHVGLDELLKDTRPKNNFYPERSKESSPARAERLKKHYDEAMVALLFRVSSLPSWWLKDSSGIRAADFVLKSVRLNEQGSQWFKMAEDNANMVDLPLAIPSKGHKPRL